MESHLCSHLKNNLITLCTVCPLEGSRASCFDRLDPTHPFLFIYLFLPTAGRFLSQRCRCHFGDQDRRKCFQTLPSFSRAMPSVQSFSISYEALNEQGTFSEGDTLRGKVTLALTKQINVESMVIKVTGDASVRWSKSSGERSSTYSAEHRYFKMKQPLILAWAKGRW